VSLEGAPILCKRCGAPTEAQPDLSLRCRFCGTPDRLPPDELGLLTRTVFVCFALVYAGIVVFGVVAKLAIGALGA
jgi:hypothetical protein